MTAHDCKIYDPACFRCALSREEALLARDPMTTEPTIGQLTEHVRDNGPTRIRHDGKTYEVKHWGTFSFDNPKEDR